MKNVIILKEAKKKKLLKSPVDITVLAKVAQVSSLVNLA